MNIKELSEKYEEYIIERRRYYHMHPELSGKEAETCKSMIEDVKALGITDIKEMSSCHGFTAVIKGGRPGRTLALRADMDALPIKEETGLPFASVNDDVMHACGHDAHMAILLGAAKILMDIKEDLCGNVKLICQPSEEYPVGAKSMVAEGAMDGVDAIYGTHVWGSVPSGCFDFTSGNRMASGDIVEITVDGVAAHGSAPNLGKDAITGAAAIVSSLQQVVSRHNDPLNPMVITLGTIKGGSRFNVIANHVFMDGTTRSFLKGTAIEDLMRPVIEKTAEAMGVDVKFDYIYMTPPVINDNEDLNEIARNAVKKLYGENALCSTPPTMGGEDFSIYENKAPGVFGLIGTIDEEKGLIYTNHHEKFTVDESVLAKGAAVMAQFAADYLSR